MMPVIIERVGMGRLSPTVSMRGPERLAIGAASLIVNRLGIAITSRRGVYFPQCWRLPRQDVAQQAVSLLRQCTAKDASPLKDGRSSTRQAACDGQTPQLRLQA